MELTLQNLWWPFRLLPDRTTGRVRVLTHRGMTWELGFEQAGSLGELCQSNRDCAEGACSAEGVCCDNEVCGTTPCSTCRGTTPGACEPVVGPVAEVDGNTCTAESCVQGGMVMYTLVAAGTSCADQDVCNGHETCDGQGVCVVGPAPELDDANRCTEDSCDPSAGVMHVAVTAGTSCADSNVCNGQEMCDGQGACLAGIALPTDDGDPCTQDACDPHVGVTHVAMTSGSGCVDNAGRTGTCTSVGVCFPTSDPEHEDGNPCTYDHAAGHEVLAGFPCEDGDLCNGSETCSATGACLAGVALVVDDGDPETLDMCDALVGVVHKVPPTISRITPTQLAKNYAFLHREPDALQIGADPLALPEDQQAMLHGNVMQRDGTPIGAVRVTVHGHEEYGRTATRPDGKFEMVVRGGGPLTVRYVKNGYLPVDRQIETQWGRHAAIDDVVMIPLDTDVTEIAMGQPGVQVAQGSLQTDADGSRQAVLLFSGDTHATAELPDGTAVVLDRLSVRATEYSVGETGPQALPAKLPVATAYTYAVELTVDEAEALGAERVMFDVPSRQA